MNIHYHLMQVLTINDLKPSYGGLTEFVKIHEITEEQIEKCFGKNYFKRNPYYRNDKAINKLLEYLSIEARVKTVYPTPSSVRFDVIQ